MQIINSFPQVIRLAEQILVQIRHSKRVRVHPNMSRKKLGKVSPVRSCQRKADSRLEDAVAFLDHSRGACFRGPRTIQWMEQATNKLTNAISWKDRIGINRHDKLNSFGDSALSVGRIAA